MKTRLVPLLSLMAALGPSQTFDFENLPSDGIVLSASQTVGGITATAAGEGGVILVFDPSGSAGLGGFGTRSLIAFSSESSLFLPLRVSFSSGLSSLTTQFGDTLADDDGTVTLSAYSSLDVLLDEQTFAYGTSNGPRSLTVSGDGIAYVIGRSDGASRNSLFWDNFTVQAVPEPSSLVVLGLGCLAAMKRRKRT